MILNLIYFTGWTRFNIESKVSLKKQLVSKPTKSTNGTKHFSDGNVSIDVNDWYIANGKQVNVLKIKLTVKIKLINIGSLKVN